MKEREKSEKKEWALSHSDDHNDLFIHTDLELEFAQMKVLQACVNN